MACVAPAVVHTSAGRRLGRGGAEAATATATATATAAAAASACGLRREPRQRGGMPHRAVPRPAPTRERSTSMCCLRHPPALPRLSALGEHGFVLSPSPSGVDGMFARHWRACRRTAAARGPGMRIGAPRRRDTCPLPTPLTAVHGVARISGAHPGTGSGRGWVRCAGSVTPDAACGPVRATRSGHRLQARTRGARGHRTRGGWRKQAWMACGRLSEPWTTEPADAPDARVRRPRPQPVPGQRLLPEPAYPRPWKNEERAAQPRGWWRAWRVCRCSRATRV